MTFESLMRELEILNPPEIWSCAYQYVDVDSLSLEILSDEEIHLVAHHFKNPSHLSHALIEYRKSLMEDSHLLCLWNLWRVLLIKKCDELELYKEQYRDWPLPGLLTDEEKALFRQSVLMTGYKPLVKALASRNLCDSESEIMSVFSASAEEHYLKNGQFGLSNEKMWWAWAFVTGKTFSLGVLQFEITRFKYPISVYVNERGETKALSKDAQGLLNDSTVRQSPGGALSNQELADGVIGGFGFNSEGFPDDQFQLLEIEHWNERLKVGEYVLNIHIPRGKKLNVVDVNNSLNNARVFFGAHFNEYKFSAFICYSWLLGSNLRQLLPSSSNIISFQNIFSLVMGPVNSNCLFDFIFNESVKPIDDLVPINSFQKNILSYLKSGNNLRDGLGYILL